MSLKSKNEVRRKFQNYAKYVSLGTHTRQEKRLRASYLNGVYSQCLTKPRSLRKFAERFYVNTIYRGQFHQSIWRRLEKEFSSKNNPLRKRPGGSNIS